MVDKSHVSVQPQQKQLHYFAEQGKLVLGDKWQQAWLAAIPPTPNK